MDVASLALNYQSQHHERFCQSWLECPELSAHIHESTVFDHFVCPLGCQNSVVSTTFRDQIF